MKTITTNATIYDDCGFIAAENVTICDHGDTVSIASTEHDKSDLTISGGSIMSEISGWSAIWHDLPRCGDYASELAEEWGCDYADALVYSNCD